MNREKQIENIAYIFDSSCDNTNGEDCETCACSLCKAEQIYNAGYRKQCEGKWIKDEKSKFKHRYYCSACNFHLIGAPTNYCEECGAKMKGAADEK